MLLIVKTLIVLELCSHETKRWLVPTTKSLPFTAGAAFAGVAAGVSGGECLKSDTSRNDCEIDNDGSANTSL